MKAATTLWGLLLSVSTSVMLRSEEHPGAPILLLPFENATGHDEFDVLGKGIPELLTAFLSPHRERVQVVDREAIERIFDEHSLSWENYVKTERHAELGKLCQARFILRGSFHLEGKERTKDRKLVLTGLLYETETTRLVKTLSRSGRAENLTGLGRDFASELASFFNARLEEFAALPVDENPEKNLAMIYGLGHFHNGQPDKALTYFLKVLENDPGDESAKYWLGRSFLAAGMVDHARIEFVDFLEKFPESAKADEVKTYLSPQKQGEKSDAE